jgi:hypothetical protein
MKEKPTTTNNPIPGLNPDGSFDLIEEFPTYEIVDDKPKTTKPKK